MKKSDRELIFNKYEGRCAYCGDPLQKGWHVDELKPIRRIKKYVPPHYINKATKLPKKPHERALNNPDFEYVGSKYIFDGCLHPERLTIENQMPACASCNINKHSMSLEEFRKLIQGFIKHLNEVNTQYKIAKRYGLVSEDIKPIVFYFEQFVSGTCALCRQQSNLLRRDDFLGDNYCKTCEEIVDKAELN